MDLTISFRLLAKSPSVTRINNKLKTQKNIIGNFKISLSTVHICFYYLYRSNTHYTMSMTWGSGVSIFQSFPSFSNGTLKWLPSPLRILEKLFSSCSMIYQINVQKYISSFSRICEKMSNSLLFEVAVMGVHKFLKFSQRLKFYRSQFPIAKRLSKWNSTTIFLGKNICVKRPQLSKTSKLITITCRLLTTPQL